MTLLGQFYAQLGQGVRDLVSIELLQPKRANRLLMSLLPPFDVGINIDYDHYETIDLSAINVTMSREAFIRVFDICSVQSITNVCPFSIILLQRMAFKRLKS